jgi:hypothetical protein
MNRRRRDRTSRAAAVIAVNGRSIMNDQVARATAALAEMRRRADEFQPLKDRKADTPYTSTGMPVCNGTGHAGAI